MLSSSDNKNASSRTAKVANLIREELSRVLIEEVSDPRLQGITVREVVLTKDLKRARILYGALQEHSEASIRAGWKQAGPFFRRRLGEGLKLRYVPELLFERDTKAEELAHLYHVLDGIKPSSLGAVEKEEE